MICVCTICALFYEQSRIIVHLGTAHLGPFRRNFLKTKGGRIQADFTALAAATFRPNFLPLPVKLCQTYFWVQMFWFYFGNTIMLLLEPEQTVVLSSLFIEAKICLNATFHILSVHR